MRLDACGHWDALSRNQWHDIDQARGYFTRGHVSRTQFAGAARRQWLDDAPRPVDVQRGYLRHVPTYSREQHPILGLLIYRGTRLVRATGPGRGAFLATWWWGNDQKERV